MTATFDNRHTDDDLQRRSAAPAQVFGHALMLAGVLTAAIAGLILLAMDHDGRFADYGAHAESYLADEYPASTVADDMAGHTIAGGTVCHDYSKQVTIAGQTETIHGTACQQPDGTWDLAQ